MRSLLGIATLSVVLQPVLGQYSIWDVVRRMIFVRYSADANCLRET